LPSSAARAGCKAPTRCRRAASPSRCLSPAHAPHPRPPHRSAEEFNYDSYYGSSKQQAGREGADKRGGGGYDDGGAYGDAYGGYGNDGGGAGAYNGSGGGGYDDGGAAAGGWGGDGGGGQYERQRSSLDAAYAQQAAAPAAEPNAAALYAFTAEGPGELSVSPGEALVVQAEVDGWLQVFRPSDGASGLVPSSYVG
jgi:hypothetical protein